jgi:hypothetical protein
MNTLLIPLGLFLSMILTHITLPLIDRVKKKRVEKLVEEAKREIILGLHTDSVVSIHFTETTDIYWMHELPQLVVTLKTYVPEHSAILDMIDAKYCKHFTIIESFVGGRTRVLIILLSE